MAELRTDHEEGILTLTISNPGQRNALNPVMYAAGVEALASAGSSADVRCIVLTGAGDNFCAGGNLQRLQENRQQPDAVQAASITGLHNWIEAIATCPKPVIAAVEGAAAGAGFSLALACDLIVAAQDALFVMAYSTVALSPDGGASWHLARALPRQLACELMMAVPRVSAQRLHELGLVNRVTEPGTALPTALDWGRQLGQRAPNALASIKELLSDAASNSLHEQLDLERDHFVRNLHHPNAGIGIAAFLQRQQPHFQR
ncbi:MAG: enoyl-CoA hydratase [Ottowia sp.]|nr:enoyl-CoA hydratase [Ottowia sp.]